MMITVSIEEAKNTAIYQAQGLLLVYTDEEGKPQIVFRGAVPADLVKIAMLRLLQK